MTSAMPPRTPDAMAEATLASGCFWCTQAVFSQLRGVVTAESGYSNGRGAAPTYEAVCTGETGYAEVVRVRFDPSLVRYRQLLEVFFATHDPTTLNQQGHDMGTQYRSAVFIHDEAQAKEAHALIQELTLSGAFNAPIVTEVTPVAHYYPAEPYHQHYAELNPHQGYCTVVVTPKLDKFRRTFAALLRPA